MLASILWQVPGPDLSSLQADPGPRTEPRECTGRVKQHVYVSDTSRVPLVVYRQEVDENCSKLSVSSWWVENGPGST